MATLSALQDTLFDLDPVPSHTKAPKLGRYDQLRRELELDRSDPKKAFVEFDHLATASPPVNFVDLFCGAGGITCGLKQAGFTPVAAVELVGVACQTHRRNFPECRLFEGPIEQFEPLEHVAKPDTVELVVGGPPCQGFSVAGRRDPNDPRNQLFRQFMRIVAALQPSFVVMENVPGILTMSGGTFKKAIRDEFAVLGYHVSLAVLEAAAYGVPQIRPRAIFVANRVDFVNPFPKPQLRPDEYRSIESAISDLPDAEMVPAINHEWTKHSHKMEARLAAVPPGGSLYRSYADAWKRQYPGMPSMTVKENHGGTHIHPHLNRVLSAREMARLQTFPDDFIFCGTMKKAMWQIGNAVPPRLAQVIGMALAPSILAAREKRLDPCASFGGSGFVLRLD